LKALDKRSNNSFQTHLKIAHKKQKIETTIISTRSIQIPHQRKTRRSKWKNKNRWRSTRNRVLRHRCFRESNHSLLKARRMETKTVKEEVEHKQNLISYLQNLN